MAIHRLRIVGIHYAVNPESTSREAETEQMHQRTAERLRQLAEQRPRVVLMPEPSNPVDSYAVMARVSGQRIGYVEKTQLDLVHALLKAQDGRPLLAQIDEVEARKHGWMYVTIQVADGLAIAPQNRPQTDWSGWKTTLPVLAPDDAHFACMEAEAVLAEVMPSETDPSSGQNGKDNEANGQNKVYLADKHFDMDLIEEYLHLWLKNSLHDLSREARLARNIIYISSNRRSENALKTDAYLPASRYLSYNWKSSGPPSAVTNACRYASRCGGNNSWNPLRCNCYGTRGWRSRATTWKPG